MSDQKINCTVATCKFNDLQRQECNLQRITVTPCCESVEDKEESMCSSYKYENE